MEEKIELVAYLDKNVPDWEKLTSSELDAVLRKRWRAGDFKRLRIATRQDAASGLAVKVGDSYYAWVVMDVA